MVNWLFNSKLEQTQGKIKEVSQTHQQSEADYQVRKELFEENKKNNEEMRILKLPGNVRKSPDKKMQQPVYHRPIVNLPTQIQAPFRPLTSNKENLPTKVVVMPATSFNSDLLNESIIPFPV